MTPLKVLPFLALLHYCSPQDVNGGGKIQDRCSCRYVTDPTEHLPVLSVDCSYLDLRSFPGEDQFATDVFSLDLSHNGVRSLDQSVTPFKSDSLKVLLLSYNEIEELDDEFFEYVPHLTFLDLSHNKIKTISSEDVFYGLDDLRVLDLSFNEITSLPSALFAPLKSLQKLDISYNDLEAQLRDVDTLSSLRIVPTLTTLQMNRVGLRDPPNNFFDDYTALKRLAIADNHFGELPFVPYSVEYLDVSGSEITALAARHLNYHSLKTLILDRSGKLEKIDRYAFYNLQSLEVLSLNDCPKLTEFDDEVFGVISRDMGLALKRLSIARGGLHGLNYTFTYLFDELEYLDLQDNPWRCDCGLLWLRIFNKSLHRSENIRCAFPLRLQGKQLMLVDDSQLPRCKLHPGHSLQKVVLPILGILIVILISLIIYLIYMAPLIYGNRFRTGPQSPYQGISVQADDLG